jgi:hypothetical protein
LVGVLARGALLLVRSDESLGWRGVLAMGLLSGVESWKAGCSVTAFEVLKAKPDGWPVTLTAYGHETIKGRVCKQPDPAKVVVFVGRFEWFEFTAQSDLEIDRSGAVHVL